MSVEYGGLSRNLEIYHLVKAGTKQVEIAKAHDLSRERVRQIVKAFDRLNETKALDDMADKDQDAAITAMREAGRHFAEIALSYQMTIAAAKEAAEREERRALRRKIAGLETR